MFHFVQLFFVLFMSFTGMNNLENKPQDTRAFKSFRAIEGHWIMNYPNMGTLHEIWTFEHDSLMLGRGFLVQGIDTTFSEHIRLELKQGKLAYCVRTSNQNEGTEIRFPLKRFGKNIWEFELLTHDFPNQIVYSKPKSDSIHVWIEGSQKGILVRETFDFIRLQ